jgi:hypothetical protein
LARDITNDKSTQKVRGSGALLLAALSKLPVSNSLMRMAEGLVAIKSG